MSKGQAASRAATDDASTERMHNLNCCHWREFDTHLACRGAKQTQSRLEALKGESGQAASGASTDDSRASRPKRARARFDYSILNGTSGNIAASIQGSILTG